MVLNALSVLGSEYTGLLEKGFPGAKVNPFPLEGMD